MSSQVNQMKKKQNLLQEEHDENKKKFGDVGGGLLEGFGLNSPSKANKRSPRKKVEDISNRVPTYGDEKEEEKEKLKTE